MKANKRYRGPRKKRNRTPKVLRQLSSLEQTWKYTKTHNGPPDWATILRAVQQQARDK